MLWKYIFHRGDGMEQLIFRHMEAVRDLTLKQMEKMPSGVIEIIPTGFNNNIHWNFGHIPYVQEKLCYLIAGEKVNLPDDYEKYFSAGTKPSDWKGTPPSMEEISETMKEQIHRLKRTHSGRLEDHLPEPYTNLMGVKFETIGDAFLFTLYHESFHVEAIKQILKVVSRKGGKY